MVEFKKKLDLQKVKDIFVILIFFSVIFIMLSKSNANRTVKYDDIYYYDPVNKIDVQRQYNPSANTYNAGEKNEMNDDSAHRAGMKVFKDNEEKASRQSFQDKMIQIRNEIDNRKKKFIKTGQHYLKLATTCFAIPLVSSAVCYGLLAHSTKNFLKAQGVDSVNFDDQMAEYVNYENELNSQGLNKNKIKNYKSFDRNGVSAVTANMDPVVGLDRTENSSYLNREQKLIGLTHQQKKQITKSLKALSKLHKKNVTFDFKKNQLLINNKPTDINDFFSAKNLASALPASEQAGFIKSMNKASERIDRIVDLESTGKSANHLLKNFSVPVGSMGSISQEMNLIVDGIQDDLNADLQAELDRKAKEEADAKNLLLSRTPSNVAGMTKDFNGSAIGLSSDSLFLMVKKRYKSEESHGAFQASQ